MSSDSISAKYKSYLRARKKKNINVNADRAKCFNRDSLKGPKNKNFGSELITP